MTRGPSVHTLPTSSGRRARFAAVTAAAAFGLAVLAAPSAAHAAPNTAVNDVYTVPAGSVFTAAAAVGLLANDVELDPTVLISISGDPVHGAITSIGNDGAFSYSPTDGFVGDDTFSYCIKIEQTLPCVSLSATVTLHVEGAIERIGGADRYAVSAGVSAKEFAPGVATAYVASGEVFPDALSASAAAGAGGAPVLLVGRDGIPAVITAELTRLKPQNIVVLGGTNTITAGVETALDAYVTTGAVTRISGADRYAVSAGISLATFGPNRPVAYIASGEVFPDALSGSAAAGTLGGPVLLVQKNSIPAVVATELARLVPSKIVVLGGTNTIADSVVATLQMTAVTNRVAGADRFVVSANVSAGAFMPADTHTVFVASGEVFPDALSGAAGAIANHAPVLLVTKNAISTQVATELDRLNPTRIVVLGGTNTISDATYAQLATHLG
ncbi:cell wall-binding repeat-containing protein [Herbiconiux sp. CPCC 205763]|uniref:Cell wall-binding repeat-containing protein n=1 Tax=Herbiconiux aconitum TaxID=2970913 RepID=A0ABT2GLZ9_9MICO|nr:cell wall-binding repeat-containing protein [Herbiconiux aconitum]MCS5717253.1 cell wall-binding repeat-containing protein [Herbiconiux aconitum]